MRTLMAFALLLTFSINSNAYGFYDQIPAIEKSINHATNINEVDVVVNQLKELKITAPDVWLIDYYTAFALIRKIELTSNVAIQLSTFTELNNLFDACAKNYPDNDELFALKANYLIKKSRVTNSDIDNFGQQEIIEAFQTAKELNPKNPRAFLVSAIYYLRANDKEMAIKNADIAVKLYNAETEEQKAVYPNWGQKVAETLAKKLQY